MCIPNPSKQVDFKGIWSTLIIHPDLQFDHSLLIESLIRMEVENVLSYGLAGAQHQEAVLRLPSERWQESDTLSVEYPHIVSDENKWGYVCTRNTNTIVSINQYKFHNLSYMGDLSPSTYAAWRTDRNDNFRSQHHN